MTTEQNKALARSIMSALSDRNLDSVISYYTPDCRFHGWAPVTLDTAGYKEGMTAILNAFPDSRFLVDDMIAEGDRVVARHHLQGTHQADFQGIPATGKPVNVNAIVIFRIENGKAAELWLNADFMGLLQQLGAVPTP
jgi:steroid delta-isomerase-like uncharacterized protein